MKAWLLVDPRDLHDRLVEHPDFHATVHFVTVDSFQANIPVAPGPGLDREHELACVPSAHMYCMQVDD